MSRKKARANHGPNIPRGPFLDKADSDIREAERERVRGRDFDLPVLVGRDVDLMAARGELNLRTWLDD